MWSLKNIIGILVIFTTFAVSGWVRIHFNVVGLPTPEEQNVAFIAFLINLAISYVGLYFTTKISLNIHKRLIIIVPVAIIIFIVNYVIVYVE